MAVKLSKGQKVDLTKKNPNLKKIIIGLGWDINQGTSTYPFDLDASVFLLNDSGKVHSEDDFIFYNNPRGGQGSVIHSGDNRTGSGAGDDEQISVDLSMVPSNISRIAFTITINDAQRKRQSFGQISNSYIRVIDPMTNEVLLQYDLGREFSVETAIVAAELYRYQGEWKFNAIGSGFQGGLAALCHNFGLETEEEQASPPPASPLQSPFQQPSFQQPQYQQPSQQTGRQPMNLGSSYGSPQSYGSSQGYGYSTQPSYHSPQGDLTCPRCRSGRVTAGKKGFGIGKAVVGSILLGPIGLLGGFLGSNNVEFLCLD